MSDVVLFADADERTGTGHVMRMLALALAVRELDPTAKVTIAGQMPEAVAARVLGHQVMIAHVDHADDRARAAIASGAHAVAADGYTFGASFQRRLRHKRVVVIDDNGENGTYDVDAVVNQNIHATEAMYRHRATRTRLLLGPRYALLRPEFRHQVRARREHKSLPRVLVTMGGSDPLDLSTAMLAAAVRAAPMTAFEFRIVVGPANSRSDALRAAVAEHPRFDVVGPVFDMAPVLAWADVAVTAAGSTVWELFALGVPTLVVSVADNQSELALRLGSEGFAVCLGDARHKLDADQWLARALELAEDACASGALTRRAHQLVDGSGALRVAQVLLGR